MTMNTQKHIHHGLALVSFGMTGAFGFSLASGLTAVLFALSMVLIQAGALLYLPERFMEAKVKDSGLEMALYGGVIVLALLLSVTASVATLSGSYEHSETALKERTTLQAAIDGYIEAGYITKAMAVRQELAALPESEAYPLASAALRVESVTGINGSSLVTGFITTLALLLDLFVVLLRGHGVTGRSHAPVTAVTRDSNALVTPVTEESNEPVTSVTEESNGIVTEESPAEPEPQTTPEVRAVLMAMNNGVIKKASVREIRQLLRCSQHHAAQIARNCRQLELSI